MLLAKIIGTLLLTASMVLASEEEPVEEKKVHIVEAIPVEDPATPDSDAFSSRSAHIDDHGHEDQIAMESAAILDRAIYAAPPRPHAIPVPLPLPVRPGSLVIPGLPPPPRKNNKGYPPASARPNAYGPPPPPGYKRVSRPHPHPAYPPPPPQHRNNYPPPAIRQPPTPVYKLPPPPPPAPAYNAPPPAPAYNAPPPAPAYNAPPPGPSYNAPAPGLSAPPPAPGYGAPPQHGAPPPPDHPAYGAIKPGDVIDTSRSEPAPTYNVPPPPPPPPQTNYNVPAPAPAPAYNVPPPPPPAPASSPTYNAPPPSPAYSPPPPPPTPSYNAPPPPPAAPVASPQTGYGSPKDTDITPTYTAPSSQPTYKVPAPTKTPVPTPSEPTYVAPPVSAPKPVPAPSPRYENNIPDSDVSGSATSYVAPESLAPEEPWPNQAPEMPKITALDVKCEKNLMKVNIEFDRPFYGIVFSKGHYSNVNCVHLPAGQGKTSAVFDVAINSCGTTGNTENGLYGYGSQSGSGTYFENTVVVQYDPQVQEVWDQARKLRCTWHDQYEKSVTFRPFPVDMLDVVRADFAGDNVGCWMQIQVGKGPWASEVSGLVKIGQTMTMVLAIKDEDNKFDMMIRNCMAHDGKRAPIQLVDQKGCVTRPKLMSRFSKIKNFGASASVLSYAHFQAFKFPDSMEVHFQCTIQICRYQCPEQCSDESAPEGSYTAPVVAGNRAKREASVGDIKELLSEQDIGVNRIIQVVSSRDLTFILDKKTGETEEIKETETEKFIAPLAEDQTGLICMSTPGFAATLIVLLAILIISCLLSAFLCLRFRGSHGDTRAIMSAQFDNPAFLHKRGHF